MLRSLHVTKASLLGGPFRGEATAGVLVYANEVSYRGLHSHREGVSLGFAKSNWAPPTPLQFHLAKPNLPPPLPPRAYMLFLGVLSWLLAVSCGMLVSILLQLCCAPAARALSIAFPMGSCCGPSLFLLRSPLRACCGRSHFCCFLVATLLSCCCVSRVAAAIPFFFVAFPL